MLTRDDKIKWLNFGMTPDPENLQPHPGFVWVKSGYSETIAWRKVRLTKQRNVDLTTDGLWAMPLNTGWVPVKARRLQDWAKLRKYVPIHKQGDVCPNEVPALGERDNNGTIRIQNNQWAPVHCSVMRIIQFLALCSKMRTPTLPLTHIFLKPPFRTDFKNHTHTHPKATIFWRIGQKVQKNR